MRRPVALSVTYKAYKRLPNDTDLTVFKRAGRAGMNFAFIDEVSHYHTPLDDLAHLDLGSLQHQGENALAVARGLAGADLAHPRPGRSCYQDLLGFALLRWPAGLTVPLAAGSVALLPARIMARGPQAPDRGRRGAVGGWAPSPPSPLRPSAPGSS